MSSPLELHTSVVDLYKYKFARLGQTTARKLAVALAGFHARKSANDATVEDLLTYLPMRYEDRSNPARIRDLQPNMEASLELFVRVSGAFEIRNRSGYGRSRL